jgi:hypothetical protein
MPKPNRLISGARFRDVIRALNGLLNVKVLMVETDKAQAVISESGTIFEIPKNGGSGQSVAINWRGEYSGSTDYAANDLVHVTSGTSISFYLCLVTNGPTAGVQAPSPGTTTTYWECYANGGGGGPTRMVCVTEYGDYLGCYTYNGTTVGGTLINVAKPPDLRVSLAGETCNAVAVTYTYAQNDTSPITPTGSVSAAYIIRTASASGYNDQTEEVVPAWQKWNTVGTPPADTIIYADVPAGGTGLVDASSNPITYQVRGNRAWCMIT